MTEGNTPAVETSLCAAGYVRVSEDREQMLSPAIQRAEIERYATAKGWTVTAWYEDIGISGRAASRVKRVGLDSLIAACLRGEHQVALFYKPDRLARDMADFFAALAVLERAGIHCDSPSNPRDGSAESDLMWGLAAALAKYESVKHGSRIADAHKRIRALGRYHGGADKPYGMAANPNGTGLVPDPFEAPVLLEMHQLLHRGYSLSRIARTLNERGIPAKRGGRWSSSQVKASLAGSYQAGGRLDEDGQLVMGDNVTAAIDRETWETSQALLALRPAAFWAAGGRTPRTALPPGVVRCGSCGCPLQIVHRDNGVALRCQKVADGVCPSGVDIKVDSLEGVIAARIPAHLKTLRGPQASEKPHTHVSTLPDAAKAARASLARLAVAYAEGDMEQTEYQAARATLRAKLAAAEAAEAAALTALERDARRTSAAEAWQHLQGITADLWLALPAETRRDLYGLILERVVVNRIDSGRPRVVVHWR